MITTHRVNYSGKGIEFYLEYKDIKNFNLRIKPDMSINVSAPLDAEIKRVYDFVSSKGNWIFKQLKTFQETKSEEKVKREFVSGETVKYLGKQYRLKVIPNETNESIKISDKYIIIETKKSSKIAHRRILFDKWIRQQAKDIFVNCLDNVYPLISKEVVIKPNLEFKQMSKRWGSSLRRKNVILLNLELIKAPKHCIEYVVLHELIHFVYKNHNRLFYDKLTVLMPDWKQRKEILDEEIVLFV
jgi:predicted metal-dependent hydrolase